MINTERVSLRLFSDYWLLTTDYSRGARDGR